MLTEVLFFFKVYYFLNNISDVFHMVPKTHSGHMKAVKKLIWEGTSKWSAKVLITGKLHWTVSECCQNFLSSLGGIFHCQS